MFEMFDQKILVKKTKPGKIDFHVSLKDDILVTKIIRML